MYACSYGSYGCWISFSLLLDKQTNMVPLKGAIMMDVCRSLMMQQC